VRDCAALHLLSLVTIQAMRQQVRKPLPRLASARSNLLPRHTEQALLARASSGGGPKALQRPLPRTQRDWMRCSASSRGHVITQHGLIGTGPLNSPHLRLHRTQASEPLPSPGYAPQHC